MTTELYKPKGSVFLSESLDNQVRLGIQGAPFSGKTTAALTFPNPVILTYDRKISAHLHRDDVPLVPFYNPAFIDTIVKRPGTMAPPERKDALIKWLETEGLKLSHEQTLLVDGLTGIEDSFHLWFKYNETELATSKKGEYNKFVQWDLKKAYFTELWNAFKAINCDVVMISHEQDDRNKDGSYNGKIKPLLTGQAADKMGGNFTDWVRQIVISKPKTSEEIEKVCSKYNTDKATVTEWCNATPPSYGSIHLWQTQGDDIMDGGCSSLINTPKFILATYDTFVKYKKNKKA
jgi:AAA domain